MLRRSIAVLAVALVTGCQDYQFNPVGKCIVQPGSSRVQLESLATADILFVVDDSGSMQSKQDRLAQNFRQFIDALAQTQLQRKLDGLDPLEFHIAITTSSIFEGITTTSTCSANATGGGASCTAPLASNVACTQVGLACNDLLTSYRFGTTCIPGVGVDRAPYPAGDFVAKPGNPRVLHFTKELKWETWNVSGAGVDPAITQLVTQFQQNIDVGTCGTGMEQHLEAGRLAVQKATTQTQPGLTPGEWLHPGAKLIVVWVGDEEDCSSPKDPTRSIAFGRAIAGDDVCTADTALPLAQQKAIPVQSYVDYFTSLGRPFGAAFIYPAVNCRTDASGARVCDAGPCSCAGSTDPNCGGFRGGIRFNQLSSALRAKEISTLDASVCDADFGATLRGIADLVKPLPGLTLPTQPAASQVAVLRIESVDGSASRQCKGPAQNVTLAEATADYDWWFVNCRTGAPNFAGTEQCIVINHEVNRCPATCARCGPSEADPSCRRPKGCGEANSGETYVAQYLGFVPPEGCTRAGAETENTPASASCAQSLGGQPSDWRCVISGGTVGTCVCAGP